MMRTAQSLIAPDRRGGWHAHRPARPGARGFTLIEVMITVVIVAVLSTLAYPSYKEAIRKSKRAEARAVLTEAAQFMQRFYSQNDRYDAINDGTPSPAAVALPAALQTVPRNASAGKQDYDVFLKASSLTPRSFVLVATPRSGGSMAGDKCGSFKVSQVGRRSVEGATVDVTQCWR